ncbi:hypothetical protein V5O48_005805 [Marasmius crinis-equi]|uniref:MYND-type domain-containing protein n=1 Tax=Marasmius crinis-equi TaxID=585013 RepID=A0ABR3FLA6_9AGAR
MASSQDQFLAVLFDMPRVQDALRNPEEWNKQWEKLLTQVDSPEAVFYTSVERTKSSFRSISDLLEYYALLRTQTCEVQRNVGGAALHFLLERDLERLWAEAGEAVRRKHTLRALSEACSIAKNLNDARAFCGDILRLESLSKDGKTLITLIKAMIPEDLSRIPKTPYYFPEPRWEALQKHVEKTFSANSVERITFDESLLLRTKLTYHVLSFMLLSFFDIPLGKPTVVKNNSSIRNEDGDRQAIKMQKAGLQAIHGRETARQLRKDDFEAYKDRKAQRRNYCRCCRKMEGDSEKFMRCQACWEKQQRDWKYCSKYVSPTPALAFRLVHQSTRDCQKEDWKPHHKAFCGKPLTAETALQSAPPLEPEDVPEALQVGPTRKGYRRSPSLIHHVYRLNSNPDADIFLNTGTGQDGFVKVDVAPHPSIQKRVRAARDKAMCEGDKTSAALLCHFEIWFFWAKHADTKQGFDFKRMVDQLEQDFNFPELKQAMLEMQTRQRRDPVRRPPLLADLDPQEWRRFVAIDYTDMNRELKF